MVVAHSRWRAFASHPEAKTTRRGQFCEFFEVNSQILALLRGSRRRMRLGKLLGSWQTSCGEGEMEFVRLSELIEVHEVTVPLSVSLMGTGKKRNLKGVRCETVKPAWLQPPNWKGCPMCIDYDIQIFSGPRVWQHSNLDQTLARQHHMPADLLAHV